MPRSFNGRTKVFEAFYVGSIPALGAKVVPAPRVRSSFRMSRRFLIVRQLVRFQPDAPIFWNCGRMVRRSTFNRDGESSILSSSTNETILPASSLVVGS